MLCLLTSRLWDIYLPYRRQNSPNRSEVPIEKKKALDDLLAVFRAKTANMVPGSMPGFDDRDFMEINASPKPSRALMFASLPNRQGTPTPKMFFQGPNSFTRTYQSQCACGRQALS
jgi:hypothetical protein